MKHIIKPSMMVVDPFWASKQYCIKCRNKDIPDNDEARTDILFYVNGFPLTSGSKVKSK